MERDAHQVPQHPLSKPNPEVLRAAPLYTYHRFHVPTGEQAAGVGRYRLPHPPTSSFRGRSGEDPPTPPAQQGVTSAAASPRKFQDARASGGLRHRAPVRRASVQSIGRLESLRARVAVTDDLLQSCNRCASRGVVDPPTPGRVGWWVSAHPYTHLEAKMTRPNPMTRPDPPTPAACSPVGT